jgi:hypothetical protein
VAVRVATLRRCVQRCDVAALGIYTVLGMFRTSSEHYSLLAQLESVASLTSLLTVANSLVWPAHLSDTLVYYISKILSS